jgi:hypothetical protein
MRIPGPAIVFGVLAWAVLAAPAAAQQRCLHGDDEAASEATRRREALTATRQINTLQANQPGAAAGRFLRHAELAGSPYAERMRESASELIRQMSLDPEGEILSHWKLTLAVAEGGYWFMIKDTADPCGFGYVSNQDGIIYTAEPI